MILKFFSTTFIFLILLNTTSYARACMQWVIIPNDDAVIVVPYNKDNHYTIQEDLDCDGILDTTDNDIDGDGILNNLDAFPRNSSENKDSDNDGVGDNADRPLAYSQLLTIDSNVSTHHITLIGKDDSSPIIYTIATQPLNGRLSGIVPNLVYTPNAGYIGKDFFMFIVNDGTHNSYMASINIDVIGIRDVTPPSVIMISPNEGSIITDKLTPLVFDIEDDNNGSGLDNVSVKIIFTETNTSYSLVQDSNSSHFTYTPTESIPLTLGNINFSVYAKDTAGNDVNKQMSIFMKEKNVLSAIPLASPNTAYAPAIIRFTPQVTTDNAIQTYSWDFTGNGSYERSDITANSYTWTYDTPGDYNVTLKVVDVNNKEILGSTIIHILNTPPQVSVESAPSNGAIPLTVNFAVTASDRDGIAQYEWDFDGDGVHDYNSTSTGNTSFEYTTEGIFNAQLRVTDNKGATALYTTPTTKVIAASQGSPTVTASGSPLTGDAPLTVNLSANAVDPQSKGFKLYEWDFDGDGVYDYNSSTSASTSFIYVGAGKFYPRVKVTTTDDRITYDALEVTVTQSVSLSVTTDTIDVLNSESTTIHTATNAKSEMKVIIEDRDHNVIKVITDWIVRDAGEYDDMWDGTDANGNKVKEADYYAVLLYKVGNDIKRVDLRDTTGGTRYNPSRTENPRSFAPFDNRPMKINFTIPYPSEIVSFIGYDYTDTRVVTLRSREVLGKGGYADNWNALNEEGQIISPPPNRWFLYGIWAFRLADNVIYVKSGAHVSAITATPPIFTPDSHEADGKPATLKIHFTLNKASTIELEFFDAKAGVAVATRTYANVQAGEQIVEFDGKDNNGVYLHSGKYSVGLRAVDENGYRSMMEYTVTRIYY